MPSKVKLVQKQIMGWFPTVIEGNKIEVDSANSAILNHLNSEDYRKVVIGE